MTDTTADISARPITAVRRDWMDVLRGVAVLLVVLAHAGLITEYHSGYLFPGLDPVLEIMTPLRMPLLFLLSGLLVPRSLAKGSRAYLSGKVRRVLYPYLLWVSLLMILGTALSGQFGIPDFFGLFIAPTSHLWFLGYLFLYYLMALVCRWVHPLVLVMLALSLVALPMDGEWERFWARAVPFFIGVAIGRDIDAFERFVRQRLLAWSFFVGGTLAMTARVLWAWGSSDMVWQAVVALTFFAGAAGIVLRVASGRWARPLRYLGRRTIMLYILHWTFIDLTLWLLVSRTSLSPSTLLAIAVVMAIVPPLVVIAITDRVWVARWLFEWNPPRGARAVSAGPTAVP